MKVRKSSRLVFLLLVCVASRNALATAASFSGQTNQQLPPVRTYGAFWEVGDDYSTTLILKNNDPQNRAFASLSIYSNEGKKKNTLQIQVEADSVRRLALASMLPINNEVKQWGGLAVEFQGNASHRMTGELVVENSRNGAVFELQLQGGYRFDTENALYAPWWLPDVGSDGTLVLFNSSDQDVIVSPSIIVEGIEQPREKLVLRSRETREVDLRALLGREARFATGSVTIRYTGSAHSVQPVVHPSKLDTRGHV